MGGAGVVLWAMVVMKFGGAALQLDSGFSDMASIIRAEPRGPLLVVVSAIGYTTRELAAAATKAVCGDFEASRATIEGIESYHADLCRAQLTRPDDQDRVQGALSALFQEVRTILHSVAVTRQLSPRTLDRVLAYGEDASRLLVCAFLRSRGIDVNDIDVRSIIVTDAEYGAAKPLEEKSRVQGKTVLQIIASTPDKVTVVQGFVGQTEDGSTTTMGKESSNLTAAFLGLLLGASEIVIWSDVEGVRSIDPKHTSNSRVRSALSYRQARLAAQQGLKLIYPTMIAPAEAAQIPIRIASAQNPHGGSTVIDAQDHSGTPVLIESSAVETSTITVMFAGLRDWIAALASLPPSIHDADVISVSADAENESFRIVVRSSAAATIALHLHEFLCSNPASI